MSNGRIRFADNFNPFINIYASSKEISDVGGMEQFVKTTSGRNLWAVCTKFHKLPNDPLIQSLSTDQWVFILLSMNQDSIEYKDNLRRSGVNLPPEENDYQDDSFDEEMQSGNLIHEGDDPEEIARQVNAMTDPAYVENLKERDTEEKSDKEAVLKQIEERVKKIQEAIGDSSSDNANLQDKFKQFDADDEEFPEI